MHQKLYEIFQAGLAPVVYRGMVSVEQPGILVWAVTDRCNSRCRMCFVWKNNDDAKDLSVDEIHNMFHRNRKFLSKIYYLSLTGGEPSLRSDLPKLLDTALNEMPNVRHLYLTTNGMLTDRIIKHTQDCWKVAQEHQVVDFTIQVSLDGIGEVHNRIRGCTGAYARVSRTLLQLVQLRSKERAIMPLINTVLQPTNLHQVSALHKFADKLNIPIMFTPIITGHLYDNRTKTETLSLNGSYEAQNIFRQLKSSETGFLRFYYDDIENMLQGKRRYRICMMGYYAFFLGADGTIFPCTTADIAFGNLRNEYSKRDFVSSGASNLRQKLHAEYCPTCPSLCYARPVNIKELTFMGIKRLKSRNR